MDLLSFLPPDGRQYVKWLKACLVLKALLSDILVEEHIDFTDLAARLVNKYKDLLPASFVCCDSTGKYLCIPAVKALTGSYTKPDDRFEGDDRRKILHESYFIYGVRVPLGDWWDYSGDIEIISGNIQAQIPIYNGDWIEPCSTTYSSFSSASEPDLPTDELVFKPFETFPRPMVRYSF